MGLARHHVLILNERHLQTVLEEYAFAYFNTARPHQGIGQRIPVPGERKKYEEGGNIFGGLHHDYLRLPNIGHVS